jgi:hypothetical protein
MAGYCCTLLPFQLELETQLEESFELVLWLINNADEAHTSLTPNRRPPARRI